MRIIVTGAGGFVGRTLIDALGDEYDVVAIDSQCDAIDAKSVEVLQGDFADPDLLAQATRRPVDALVHLATVPGGAAELCPMEAFRVNVGGSAAILDRVADAGRVPRVVFASSIAVFGDPMPDRVKDSTPVSPRMVYGAHKAMIEQWVATLTRRGQIEGLSLRLPGIVARPRAPSGMKSAFMSDIFHAADEGQSFVSPVSTEATLWLMSLSCLVRNLLHALHMPSLHEPHAVTLPAVRTTMGDLATEIAAQTARPVNWLQYVPDDALEAAFGRQPPLETPAAEAAGLASDGSLEALVASSLATIRKDRQ